MKIEVHGKTWDRVYLVVQNNAGFSLRSEYFTTYESRQQMAKALRQLASEIFPEGDKTD